MVLGRLGCCGFIKYEKIVLVDLRALKKIDAFFLTTNPTFKRYNFFQDEETKTVINF